MAAVIENPILNSPFREPTRHWRFDADGITDSTAEGRRESSYFIPVPPPRKKGGQLTLQGEDWTAERMEPNVFVNQVREHVALFRRTGHPGVTPTTRELLDYWVDPARDRPLFFCQIEALETAIFLTEVAGRTQPWIENRLREENERRNAGLYRTAFKMATGAGKTVVMGMLIAWQALNKIANPQDRRFGDTFLIVTPGLTIRDRLRVLMPNDPGNYYQERDLVTPDQLDRLQGAHILITNFHAFLRRDTLEAASLTKKVLVGPEGDLDRFKETPDQMVRRVCRTLGNRKNIVVLNDEAHHCYQSAPPDEAGGEAAAEKLTAEDRTEANQRAEEARVWLNGLRAVKDKLGVRAVYDLSATPFFLRGSGYREGTLFPWVVSDFGLIDAIESGIVKIPRVPVSSNALEADMPAYRDLWIRVRDGLPRKGRATEDLGEERTLPAELEGALLSLYGDYERSFDEWRAVETSTPPVFIVVCQNTNISKLVFDWIAGYERKDAGGSTTWIPGHLALFSNVEASPGHSGPIERPNTLLIDSAQLESGSAMDPAFKRIAATEIGEFKHEYAIRYPGRSAEDITDEDLLREVLQTVGKRGRLGERVRCVVSVSMLTEGWDANTVTHILGIRAFRTQLLCEQVVGRGLRRLSYDANEEGMFEPEYAEVYGVPFSFIQATVKSAVAKPKSTHRVRALPERAELELTFPRLTGYRYDLPTERLDARFTEASVMTLTTAEVPTLIELDPIVGERLVLDLGELERRRLQEVGFRIARRTLDTYFRDDAGAARPWLFPQLVPLAMRWLQESVVLGDGAFRQMLLLSEWQAEAASKLYNSIARASVGENRLLPILRPYDPIGSTRYVDFTTTRKVYATTKSHLNHLVLDSNWEAATGNVLDHMDEVRAYAKNQGLNLKIPYTYEGKAANYLPDLLVQVDDGHEDPLNLLIEVTGEKKKEKAAKVDTAASLWVPAVNNDGHFGRWSFVEVTDPATIASDIRAHLASLVAA